MFELIVFQENQLEAHVQEDHGKAQAKPKNDEDQDVYKADPDGTTSPENETTTTENLKKEDVSDLVKIQELDKDPTIHNQSEDHKNDDHNEDRENPVQQKNLGQDDTPEHKLGDEEHKKEDVGDKGGKRALDPIYETLVQDRLDFYKHRKFMKFPTYFSFGLFMLAFIITFKVVYTGFRFGKKHTL